MALADACEIFSAQADRAKHSLMAPPGHLALDRPLDPDAWMLQPNGQTLHDRLASRSMCPPSQPYCARHR